MTKKGRKKKKTPSTKFHNIMFTIYGDKFLSRQGKLLLHGSFVVCMQTRQAWAGYKARKRKVC